MIVKNGQNVLTPERDKNFSQGKVDAITLQKKRSFPLRISSVNVTQSAGNCGFGYIYRIILNKKLHFLFSVNCAKSRYEKNVRGN